jgi:homoserine dehydrogenase
VRPFVNDVALILLGFGNVGQTLAELLRDHDGYASEGARITLRAVFDRGGGVAVEGREASELLHVKRSRGTVTALEGATKLDWTEAFDLAERSVLVDTSITNAETGEPGIGPAKRALENGVPVVFASKGPLVARYAEVVELAARRGARLGASAAVGIPLPSIEVGVLGVRGAGLSRFRGVFNDTANQILRDLESGISLESAVERARLEGTIEEDPRLDLDGWDAAYKLLILARAIWDPRLSLDDISTTGVSAIGRKELDEARSRRQRLRLIATGIRQPSGEVLLKVGPEALDIDDPLYPLGRGEKGVVFETETMGTITLRSTRGGPLATAAAIIKDVLNVVAPKGPF